MVNGVGFMVSEEEDLASGPGTSLDHSRAFMQRSFISENGPEKASDTDITKGSGGAPSLVLTRSYIFFNWLLQ